MTHSDLHPMTLGRGDDQNDYVPTRHSQTAVAEVIVVKSLSKKTESV